MADIVFHLMTLRAGRVVADAVLRFNFDPACDVERGDIWGKPGKDGASYYRVNRLRIFQGENGEELHAFMLPHMEPAVL